MMYLSSKFCHTLNDSHWIYVLTQFSKIFSFVNWLYNQMNMKIQFCIINQIRICKYCIKRKLNSRDISNMLCSMQKLIYLLIYETYFIIKLTLWMNNLYRKFKFSKYLSLCNENSFASLWRLKKRLHAYKSIIE